MRPRPIALLASSLGLLFAAMPAHGQGCPDGDWFCEPAPEPPPQSEQAPEAPPTADAEREAPGPPKVARWRGEFLPDEPPPPPRRTRRLRRHEWGFDVHVLGALMAGDDVHPDAGMGGLGFGLRFRPIPHFAVDGTLELAFGNDYNGHERIETAVLANAVGFFNPQNKVQFYVLAGFGVSAAEVTRGRVYETLPYGNPDEEYTYFGMHIGAGIEGRLTRRTALRFDWVGFVRGRTDDHHRSRPEFVDGHRTTNTSAGSFVRGGAVFYW